MSNEAWTGVFMSERPSESQDELVNEELHDYEGFPAILALLQRAASEIENQPVPGQLAIDLVRRAAKQTPEAERAAQTAAYDALVGRPEISGLVQVIEDIDKDQRSRALSVLFASSGTDNPSEE